MRNEVAKDLSRSAKAFLEIVWPVIRDSVGGGELVPVESVTAEGFTKELDQLAGIDAWQIIRADGIMRGIASRVQWVKSNPYNSFTIRKSRTSGAITEYEKRLLAMKKRRLGALFPGVTVQAYLEEQTDKLLSVAHINTYDLFHFVYYGKPGFDYIEKPNKQDGNVFICAFWRKLQDSRVMVTVIGSVN